MATISKLEMLAYFSKVAREQVLNPAVPLGELYGNVLADQHPELEALISNDAELDPYLSDENIPAFLKWIADKGE
jgi:hypothetical protein